MDSSQDSSQYQHCYQQFKQQLVALHQLLTDRVQSRGDSRAIVADFKQAIPELKISFQEQIASLNFAGLSSELAHFLLSYQVEIDKQLRLLAMDVSFFQAARQPATVAQRQQQIADRLITLQRYCEAVLSKVTPDTVAESAEIPGNGDFPE